MYLLSVQAYLDNTPKIVGLEPQMEGAKSIYRTVRYIPDRPIGLEDRPSRLKQK